MSLIHALVARSSTILAEHKSGSRDFSQGMRSPVFKLEELGSLISDF
ncbi:hypothetical protein MPER_14270 [Moniliophthora perniciosa FA553]|nr:hypothetical protein MPER_14270 [Moniliophthora perniciosa FA553]